MKRTLLGVLTPSSNTVLEPLTSAIVSDIADVSAHFARFRVTQISRGAVADAQFEVEKQLAASDMLADARVDAIVWSGTAASWLGFDKDARLCEAINQRTGIVAGSSVLAINELFAAVGAKTFGLVTPYTQDVQDGIVANYAGIGLECIGERHLDESRNFEFSNFSEETIGEMIEAVAVDKPDAITIMCTNMRGARIAPHYEEKLGIPIFDSTSAAVWSALRLAGRNPADIKGWGQLFEIP